MENAESKAAKWLRKGARMLAESCPLCGFPLFERRGEYWCPSCDRPIMREKEREILVKIEEKGLLRRVEETLVGKISRLERELQETNDHRRIHLLSSSLFMLLSSLDVVKRLVKEDESKKERP